MIHLYTVSSRRVIMIYRPSAAATNTIHLSLTPNTTKHYPDTKHRTHLDTNPNTFRNQTPNTTTNTNTHVLNNEHCSLPAPHFLLTVNPRLHTTYPRPYQWQPQCGAGPNRQSQQLPCCCQVACVATGVHGIFKGTDAPLWKP